MGRRVNWCQGRFSPPTVQRNGLTCIPRDVALVLIHHFTGRLWSAAVIFDELGPGQGGEHRDGALADLWIGQRVVRGSAVGVPNLVADLRVETPIPWRERAQE